ncbi:MAG: amidohydrolase [Armatimonadetes bacterium]|nr:amidohydrolase [Armatimonadota bacterium]
MPSLRERIAADHGYITAIRHDLHQHPELMYEEHRTSGVVQRELEKIGLQFKAGMAQGTGVLGFLPATQTEGAKTVALRADMDALPIHEETGLAYASQTDGKMHACGHDGHTANLIGVARALVSEENRRNSVLFVFQPAEEGGAGGDRMCQEGALSGEVLGSKADVVYGLHGWPEYPAGEILTRNGPLLAATDDYRVWVKGKGGHAAAPHTTCDPVIATAHIITAIQTICSRNVDPLDSIVFTIGAVNGGTAHNVIPETMKFVGTMRTLKPETRVLGRKRFYELVEGVAAAFGCQIEIDWNVGYPVTANDPWATDRFRQICLDVVGEGNLAEKEAPVMGGEDFSYYGAYAPASFFLVGLKRDGDENPASVHTPRFDFNDAVLPRSVEIMCRLSLDPVEVRG